MEGKKTYERIFGYFNREMWRREKQTKSLRGRRNAGLEKEE